jgi:hypothetical protein
MRRSGPPWDLTQEVPPAAARMSRAYWTKCLAPKPAHRFVSGITAEPSDQVSRQHRQDPVACRTLHLKLLEGDVGADAG